MNTNLDTAIQTLIAKALDGVDASVTFLQAEIPDYVYQLLLWYGVKNAIVAGIFFIVTIACIVGIRNISKHGSREEATETEEEVSSGLCIALGFVGIISLLAFFPYAFEALQIYIAPKVWLLEYASGLIK